MTISVTSDFRDQYEFERARWLRLRFQWYAVIVIAFALFATLSQVLFLILDSDPEKGDWTAVSVQESARLIAMSLYAVVLYRVFHHACPREQLLRSVTRLIVTYGSLMFAGFILASELRRMIDHESMPPEGVRGYAAGIRGIAGIFVSHFFACLFLPWTWRESLRPIYPLLVINALISIVYGLNESWAWIVIPIVLSPLVALPGSIICLWRQGRFRRAFQFQMLRGHYGEMRRELVDAQRIHDALFPEPINTGPIRLSYEYEPMRQIGGDYLFSRVSHRPGQEHPALTVVLVDVTGHGVSAALTVNRLHGEIEREFGASPDISPGELLHGLNDYLHHTLASHSVYATVFAAEFDPNTHEMKWANAGHPPAFLRGVDGTLDQLDSTTFVLGACHGEDFQSNERVSRFLPGDALIAYTDGATEARDANGRMLRVEGVQKILLTVNPGDGWSSPMLRAVNEFRHGPAQDDTLIVEVFRPIDAVPVSPDDDG